MKIGLGTAAIGRPHYINLKAGSENTDPFNLEKFTQKGIVLLSAAYKKGIRHFDAAPGYGIAEQILLKWIELEQPENITVRQNGVILMWLISIQMLLFMR